MSKIGVVGPRPSIERIQEVAKEMVPEIPFLSFPYDDPREVQTIIPRHRQEVDGWLLSGPIPYMIGQELFKNENVIYCPMTGAALYRCLIQMAYDQSTFPQSVSIDMLESNGQIDINASLQELDIPIQQFHIRHFARNYQREELIDFHLNLWQEGATQGAITSLNSVYRALQKEGVPVYRIFMTKTEIRQAMATIVEKVKGSYFKDSQIGITFFSINHFDQLVQQMQPPYFLQHLELQIKKILLSLCEAIDGSLTENGSGHYQIFSTRGSIERHFPIFQQTVQRLTAETQSPVTVGIGFGPTAVTAETNARLASKYSLEKPNSGIVIVQDDGQITESIEKRRPLCYPSRSQNQKLLQKLHQANVSIKTYERIKALVQQMNWREFTAAMLATELSMTIRNAQRILASLAEVGLVQHVGDELQSSRGRPRKLYQIVDEPN